MCWLSRGSLLRWRSKVLWKQRRFIFQTDAALTPSRLQLWQRLQSQTFREADGFFPGKVTRRDAAKEAARILGQEDREIFLEPEDLLHVLKDTVLCPAFSIELLQRVPCEPFPKLLCLFQSSFSKALVPFPKHCVLFPKLVPFPKLLCLFQGSILCLFQSSCAFCKAPVPFPKPSVPFPKHCVPFPKPCEPFPKLNPVPFPKLLFAFSKAYCVPFPKPSVPFPKPSVTFPKHCVPFPKPCEPFPKLNPVPFPKLLFAFSKAYCVPFPKPCEHFPKLLCLFQSSCAFSKAFCAFSRAFSKAHVPFPKLLCLFQSLLCLFQSLLCLFQSLVCLFQSCAFAKAF
eukprot:s117_g46.t1